LVADKNIGREKQLKICNLELFFYQKKERNEPKSTIFLICCMHELHDLKNKNNSTKLDYGKQGEKQSITR
jgi:hypothetical protein